MAQQLQFDVRKISLTFLAGASAWPIVACEIRKGAESPLDRALAHGALCGQRAFGAGEILGHCPACYVGLAGFAMAMWLMSRLPEAAAQSVRA